MDQANFANRMYDDLMAASQSNDRVALERIYRLLREPRTIEQLGEAVYENIGEMYDVDFILERQDTVIVLGEIRAAYHKGARFGEMAVERDFDFVEFVHDHEEEHPSDVTEISECTVISMLMWAHRTNSRLVLERLQNFLVDEMGDIIFNEHQLLHLANRFDLPMLRHYCYLSQRCIEDVEDFMRCDKYHIQTSDADKVLVAQRLADLTDLRARNEAPFDFFECDAYSGLNYEEYNKTRFAPDPPVEP